MPLESASVISELVITNPTQGDPTNQGDDHLTLIKSVLQLNFPGALGGGFAEPILASEAELNYLIGVTSPIQDQLTSLSTRVDGLEGVLNAEPNTRMVFNQPSAPLGWTQDTTLTNHMLRIVGGSGGAVGGSDSPILNNKVSTHNHSTNVVDPGHNHNAGGQTTFMTATGPYTNDIGGGYPMGQYAMDNAATGISVSVNNNAGDDWTPLYTDSIVCSKD